MQMHPIDGALVLHAAMRWVGTPYRHQGSLRGVGCDCLGLLRGIWRDLHGPEPERPGPYAQDWAEAGAGDPLMEAARRHLIEANGDPRVGDVLLFRWRPGMTSRHVGIAAGEDRFIHAYQGAGVLVSSLVPQWQRRLAARFRIPADPAN